jgi:hypothetical protein
MGHPSIWNVPKANYVPEQINLKFAPSNSSTEASFDDFFLYILRLCLVTDVKLTTPSFWRQELFIFFLNFKVFLVHFRHDAHASLKTGF